MYVGVSGEGYARVIQFVEQHRIPHIRKKKTRVIQTLGNYEKILAENPNILEELRELARQRTLEKNRADRRSPFLISRKKSSGSRMRSTALLLAARFWKRSGETWSFLHFLRRFFPDERNSVL